MTDKKKRDDKVIVNEINALIKEKVRPALLMHGGSIDFIDYKDGEVFVKLTGACHGCPMASQTLKNGVEEVLKHYIPEVGVVKSIQEEGGCGCR